MPADLVQVTPESTDPTMGRVELAAIGLLVIFLATAATPYL